MAITPMWQIASRNSATTQNMMPQNRTGLRQSGGMPSMPPEVNPYSGQIRPTPNPQLEQDIGAIWNNYGQRVVDYSTKPISTPWGNLPITQSQIPLFGGFNAGIDPSGPLTETLGAVATSPFRKTSYEQMPIEQKFPVEMAASFLVPFPGGKTKAITQAEKLMARGYKAGHTLEQMMPEIIKATGLTEDAVANLSRTLGISAGARMQTPAQRANMAALGRAGATLKESPLRTVAAQASTEGTVAVQPFAKAAAKQKYAAGASAQREAYIAEQAASTPNPFANRAKEVAKEATKPVDATWWEKFQSKVFDTNYILNSLGSRTAEPVRRAGYRGANTIETMLALYKGASWRGVQLARDTYKKAAGFLGDVAPANLDDFLSLKHAQSIFEMNPNRGKIKFGNDLINQIGVDVKLKQLYSTLTEQQIAQLEQAAGVVTEHYNSLLQRAADAGSLNQKVVDLLVNKYKWYNPIKYDESFIELADRGSDAGLPKIIKLLGDQAPELAQKKPLEILAAETIRREKLIQQATIRKAIADAAAADERLAKEMRQGAELSKFKVWENGVQKTIVAPKYLAEAVENFFAVKDPGSVVKVINIVQDISRAGMTRYNPAFYLPNFVIDVFTAFMTQGVSPLKSVKYLGKNIWSVLRENKKLAEMNRAGVEMANISAKDVEKEAAKGNVLLDGRKGWGKIVQFMDELNSAFELAPRMAAYETALERGFATDQAALFARRVTIDFARGGESIKQLNTVFLFLNAAFQGAAIIPRASVSSSKFKYMAAGFGAALAGLYAHNSQYDEYYDVPEYIRKGSLIVMLPSDEVDKDGRTVPHYARIIPALREFSLFQAAIVEVGDIIKNEDPQSFVDFLATTAALVSPVSSLVETGSQGAFIPVPTQLGRTAAEVAVNYDPFRQRNIVSDYMKEQAGGEKSKEFNQYTSMLARRIGDLTAFLPGGQQASPQVVDYIIRNLTGGAGQAVVSAYDAVDKAVTGLKKYDSQAVQYALQLKAIQTTSDPEWVSTDRQTLLNSLAPDVRKQVLEIENIPEMRVPIIGTIINRVYGSFGGRQEDIATAKAKQETEPEAPPQEQFVADTTTLVRGAIKGTITREQLDKELSKLKAFRSGASAQRSVGQLYSSDIGKYMPGGLPEPQKALDDYFAQMDLLTAKYGGYPDGGEWAVINSTLDKYMKSNYSAKAIKYVNDNKMAWIKDLPPDVQKYLLQRDKQMAANTWWGKGYKGAATTTYNPYAPAPTYNPFAPQQPAAPAGKTSFKWGQLGSVPYK